MNARDLLKQQFGDNEAGFAIVFEHSRLVADRALRIAADLGLDRVHLRFVEEAALLHDIGVVATASPRICCTGAAPYICHGILGREILEREGYPEHALVCERHIGVGLTVDDIIRQELPLPLRDMVPVTVSERIICFADLFYTKKPGRRERERSAAEVRESLARFGEGKVEVFESWLCEFGSASRPNHCRQDAAR